MAAACLTGIYKPNLPQYISKDGFNLFNSNIYIYIYMCAPTILVLYNFHELEKEDSVKHLALVAETVF